MLIVFVASVFNGKEVGDTENSLTVLLTVIAFMF